MNTIAFNRLFAVVVTAAFSFLLPSFALASACCGGAFSIPSLITGDDRAQATLFLSQSDAEVQVNGDGVWTKSSQKNVLRMVKFEGAVLIADRWQVGGSLPFQIRERSGSLGGVSSGVGDVTGMLGYEFLTDWDYHPFRPKGVGFFSLTAPTGQSPYDEDVSVDGGLSVRGRGFWSLGAGTVFTKIIRAWDVNANFEVHRSFERKVGGNTFSPGFGQMAALGVGWNTEKFRAGAAVSFNNEEAVHTSGAYESVSSPERFATGTLTGSYLFPELWAASLNYSDQTLFGSPTNATLSKSISLLLQKRWNR